MFKRDVDKLAIEAAIIIIGGAWSYGTLRQINPYTWSEFGKKFFTWSYDKYFFLPISICFATATAMLLYQYLDDGYRGKPYHQWLSGSRMKNWNLVNWTIQWSNFITNCKERLKRHPALSAIRIGFMRMPLHLENRNTLIVASIGSGKSVTMESMIESALLRGDKMMVVDPNGHFYSKFGKPDDVILNPFDKRSVGWSIFNEIDNEQDFDRIAKSIIPPQPDANSEQWLSYTRDMLADAVRKLRQERKTSHDELVRILIREDGEALKDFFSDTDSRGYFRDNAEKAIASVQFIMNKYIRPLRVIRNGDFSVRKWVEGKSTGNLYITWREDMRASQLPLVAAWVDTACAAVLSNPPMDGTRLWMFIDELESLGKLESFVPAATRGRQHGLRIVGNIQDWSQLDSNFGHDAARTITSCFRNYVILGAANAYNAERASYVLGKQKVEQRIGNKAPYSYQEHHESVVTPSEISNLKDLTGYIHFAEAYPIAKVTFDYIKRPTVNPAIDLVPMKIDQAAGQ